MDELFIQPIQVKTMESGIESISANGGADKSAVRAARKHSKAFSGKRSTT